MLFDLPKEQSSIIKVIGIGGGGCNAVNHMFRQGIKDVNFVICNTDSQALETSPVPNRIQLGPELTKGRGAGAHPEKGQAATLESVKEVKELMEKNTEMVFITAGMGGGTGTGGAPVVARIARDMGILTVAIVTLPFGFEGKKRVEQARRGIAELKEHVDSIIVIVNDKIREVFGDLPFSEAFARADDVLTTAAKGIAEIITIPGYVNVDFEDVKTVLRNSGVAIMGTGRASGENRAIDAVEAALSSPLLNDTNIQGARHVLLNITSGRVEVRMDEISEITEYVQEAAGMESDIIWGNCMDESLGDELSVTVIATGFESHERVIGGHNQQPARKVLPLNGQEAKPEAAPTKLASTSTEPHLRTATSAPGRPIQPFVRHIPVIKAMPEPDSEVLPFAYDVPAVEEEMAIRPASTAFSQETVGRMTMTSVSAVPEAEFPVDPAQTILVFDQEVSVGGMAVESASSATAEAPTTGLQQPVGLDDDPEWDEEDDNDDDELDWDDEDEDDDVTEDEEDEDLRDANKLVWTIENAPQPVAKAPKEPVSLKEPQALPQVYAVLPQTAPISQTPAETNPPQHLPAAQRPVTSAQEEGNRKYPGAKPGLLVRTVYPDGELAKPPAVPPRAVEPLSLIHI